MGNLFESFPDCGKKGENDIEGGTVASDIELILMGTGDTGKTTILKQLQIIYEKKYEDVELLLLTIYKNCIYSIQVLIKEAKKTEEKLQEGNISAAEELLGLSYDEDTQLDEEIGGKLIKVWKDPLIQQLFKNRVKFEEQLVDQIE